MAFISSPHPQDVLLLLTEISNLQTLPALTIQLSIRSVWFYIQLTDASIALPQNYAFQLLLSAMQGE